MSVILNTKIDNCYQCPFFSKKEVRHWLIDGVAHEYICKRAERNILPSDGVKPPPTWCPLQKDGEV